MRNRVTAGENTLVAALTKLGDVVRSRLTAGEKTSVVAPIVPGAVVIGTTNSGL